MRKVKADVVRAVRDLERQRDGGSVRPAGRVWTVGEWLTYWVAEIAGPAVRENTLSAYRVAVNVHLIPGVGAHRLDRLEPEHAGPPWPARAQAAVLALEAETAAAATDNASDRIRLLADVHAAFRDLTAIPTTLLLQRLRADQEAPWGEYGPAGLTARRLGALLADYGIRSRNVRFTEGQAKGYQRADFTDTWTRYTPHLVAPTPDQGVVRPIRPTLARAGQPGTANVPGTDASVPGASSVPLPTCDATGGTAGTGDRPAANEGAL